jgi:hypothetical protein
MNPPMKTWGGRSHGAMCAVCDGSIVDGTVEIDVDGADGRQRSYHLDCYRVLAAVRAEGLR